MQNPYGENLPIFPYLGYAPITIDRVERVIQRLVDRAEATFLDESKNVTQAQYDAWNKALNNWAKEQFARASA